MSGRKNRVKNPAASRFIKAFVVFSFLLAASFAAMAFAFHDGEEEAFKNDATPSPSASADEASQNADSTVIFENIFINETNVGGLTMEEAAEKLNSTLLSAFDDKKIIFLGDGTSDTVSFSQLNTAYAVQQAVSDAYQYGRGGTQEANERDIAALKQQKYTVEMPITYDQARLATEISRIAAEQDVPVTEPTFRRVDGEFAITQEAYGKSLDQAAAAQQADALLTAGEGGEIALVFSETVPQYTAAEFSKATDLIGSFTTTFSAGSNGRNQNLTNAANKINDTVLMPGATFSTNEAFGEMTFENGYALGSTIVGGKLEDGIGGGVCQVSSTLYDALLYAELDITERQNHSLKVGYMDWGFDATLAGDYIDLKFQNDTAYPVTIEAYTTTNQVVVNVYGYEVHAPGRSLVFENALVKTVQPAAEVVTEDPSLPQGQRVEDIKPRTGYVYNVYKLVYQDGELAEKVQINTSSYRATRGEFRVGTGAAATPVNTAGTPEAAPNASATPPEAVSATDAAAETPATDGTAQPTPTPVNQETQPAPTPANPETPQSAPPEDPETPTMSSEEIISTMIPDIPHFDLPLMP